MARPDYQALNTKGLEFTRQALVVGELPSEQRMAALEEAGPVIAKRTGLKLSKRLPFGSPIFTAFEGMNRPRAKNHQYAKLLLTYGEDLSLDFCHSYCQ